MDRRRVRQQGRDARLRRAVDGQSVSRGQRPRARARRARRLVATAGDVLPHEPARSVRQVAVRARPPLLVRRLSLRAEFVVADYGATPTAASMYTFASGIASGMPASTFRPSGTLAS